MQMRGKLFSRWKDGRLCSHFLETIQWTEWRKVRLRSHLLAHQWWPPLSFCEHIALLWIHFTNENAQWKKVRLSALTHGSCQELCQRMFLWNYIIENPWITNWWLFPLHPAPLSLLSDIWHFFAGSPLLKPISCKGYHQEKETKWCLKINDKI